MKKWSLKDWKDYLKSELLFLENAHLYAYKEPGVFRFSSSKGELSFTSSDTPGQVLDLITAQNTERPIDKLKLAVTHPNSIEGYDKRWIWTPAAWQLVQPRNGVK